MRNQSQIEVRIVLTLCLLFIIDASAYSQTKSPTSDQKKKETLVTKQAKGTFDVKMTPQTAEDNVGDATIGRMSLDKEFHGDLSAKSKGQMLAAMTDVQGSAGYVALERVNGTLNGLKGTFALQHSGTMNRSVAGLSITVVPDSATGELVGLAGKMTIDIVDGKHFYTFEYTITR